MFTKSGIFKIKKRKSIFTAFLISYLVILIIPIIIGNISYIKSSKVLKQQAGNYNIALLDQSREIIDGYLYSIDQLMSGITLDPKIQTTLSIQNPMTYLDIYNLSQISEDIAKYKNSNSFIDDIWIYYRSTDVILNHSGKNSVESFYQRYSPYSAEGLNEWKGKLLKTNYKQYYPAQTVLIGGVPKKVITCYQSLPAGEAYQPLGNAVVQIDVMKIESILKNIDTLGNGSVFILNKDNQVILNVGNEKLLKKDIYEKLVNKKDFIFDRIDNQEVIISCSTSEFNQWKYISISPTRVYMYELDNIRVLTFVLIIVELLIGFALSYLLARKNYFPIKQLLENLAKKLGGNVTPPTVNELFMIEEATNAIITESDKIKRAMAQQQPIILSNIIMQLIKGNISNLLKVKEYMKSLGIDFKYSHFCVIVVHIDDCSEFVKEESLEQQAIIKFVVMNSIEELVKKEFNSYVIDMDLYEVAVIMNVDPFDQDCSNKIHSIASFVKEFMEQKFQTIVSIGIGDVQEGIKGISASYREGLKALEYKMVKGQGIVVAYNGISSTSIRYNYQMHTEMQLYSCMKVGDIDKVIALLDEIFVCNFKDSNISIEMAKCLFFDIMSTGIKVLNDANIKYESNIEETFTQFTRLISCKTVDEMYETLKDIFVNICHDINNNKKSHNEELKEKIIDYINSESHNNMMSLTSVADALDISSSYLSYFFKEQTGENFFEYLTNIRIEKTKKLLRETSLTLSEISEKVGYSNSGVLIRAFKKHQGITPGQYKGHMAAGGQ